jgi:hypothetical protein
MVGLMTEEVAVLELVPAELFDGDRDRWHVIFFFAGYDVSEFEKRRYVREWCFLSF